MRSAGGGLKNCVTFFHLACLTHVNEEDITLTECEEADALNRNDDLGRLVTCAFSFAIAPFDEVFGGGALAATVGKEAF